MIENNDLLSEIILLPIPQELIDMCKYVNKCAKDASALEIMNSVLIIASILIKNVKAMTIEKGTNVKFKNFKTIY